MTIFFMVYRVEDWWVRIFPGGMDGKSVHGKERQRPDW